MHEIRSAGKEMNAVWEFRATNCAEPSQCRAVASAVCWEAETLSSRGGRKAIALVRS